MQDPVFVHDAFARIARRYVITNHVLSLWTDILWRRKVARQVRALAPQRVLDLATGSGDLAEAIRKACPDAEITGADFSAPMLDVARARNVPGVTWIEADAMALPFPDAQFDVITVAFGLRNMADWSRALREWTRVLRPGGTLIILDFSLPRLAPVRAFYRFYLHHVMPRVAGWITGQRDAYAYLSGSIEKFPSGEAMCDLIRSNGFATASADPLSLGIASVYTAVTPQAG